MPHSNPTPEDTDDTSISRGGITSPPIHTSHLEDLESAAAERERTGLAFIADLRTEFATIDAAEHYRAEKYRAAAAAGDDDEARRWERLVPIGCSLGNHRWYRWPAGYAECLDCHVEPDEAVAV